MGRSRVEEVEMGETMVQGVGHTDSRSHVMRRVASEVERIGSIKAAAREWGVHPSLVGAMIRGEKRPGRAVSERLGLPWSGERRGGKPDRGVKGRSRGRAAPAPAPPPAPVPTSTAIVGLLEEQAEHRRRAAEIRAAGAPSPSSPVVARRRPAWAARLRRAHLRRERAIRAYGLALAARVAGREAAQAAGGST